LPSDGFEGGSVIVKTSFIQKIIDPKKCVHYTGTCNHTCLPTNETREVENIWGEGVNRESMVNENNIAFKNPFTF
jgi:hypothetical protein